jgi:ABC-2 type transport system permease protein
MLNLILKDILIQKKSVLFAFGYCFFLIFAFQSLEDMGFVSATIVVVYILILSAFAYEDKNKTEVMLNSLPISRRDIILSKYLSVFVFTGLGLIAYMAAATVVKLINLPLYVSSISLPGIIGLLIAVTFMASIYFPVIFKFGYIKSKLFNVVIFLFFFFVPNLIMEFCLNNPDNKAIADMIHALQSKPA